MNSVEAMMNAGVLDQVKDSILPGETYLIGPSGIDGSADAIGAGFRKAAERIRAASPNGARIIAWFCLKTDGSRLDGQIGVDAAEGAPQIVWTLGGGHPELDYGGSKTIRFPSDSEKMVVAAEPLEALRHVGTKHDDATVELLSTLGYQPVLPMNQNMTVSFDRLALEPADA